MKTLISLFIICILILYGCGKEQSNQTSKSGVKESAGITPEKDNVSKKDVVKIAAGSPDHTTLVTAVTAADLVTSLSNAGPFTVFAPVNSAFEKLPKGTIEELLKPENKSKLSNILYHHVIVGVMNENMLTDGMSLTMFDGKPVKVTKKDGVTYIDKAKITATVPASNGIVYIVDDVILAQ